MACPTPPPDTTDHTAPAPTNPGTPALRSAAGRWRAYGLLAPALAIIALIMLVPLGLMLVYSFLEPGRYGGVEWSFSPEAYIRFLFERQLDDSLVFNQTYLLIFLRSFALSLATTLIALALAFPAALYMAMQPPKWRLILIFLVTIPFWTNLLVRNFAWILILRDRGLINNMLMEIGLISEPLPLIYNNFGILVGLVYSFIPFMVLPIYASLEKLDFRLVEAAYDLGATKMQAIRRIILPLAKPGLYAGCVLVFVPSLGSYITPELLGGGQRLMIGNLIQLQFGASNNWPFGAAMAFVLMVVVLIAVIAYIRRVRRQTTDTELGFG